ncbi:DNA mismatch repair endonuclease MutL, partial [bacterium]|nr:DNA mismatch repair endonuclease MutL [bacterium]
MNDIKILKDHVINKIAAGEVIERPASVVKELIENSIDSHSTKISIDIKKAGRMFIKVIDDGVGMSEENALLCLERHATSKINNDDDIFSIITLGFRGEAIPSIAAISKMTITTRETNSIEGTQIKIEGGNIKRVTPAACPEGTAVTIRNLFFNTPVRLRYLKSDAAEGSEIVETVKNLALAHPSISFSLVTNNRLIFKTPGNGKLAEAIISIFGTKIFDMLIPIQFSSIMEIEGMTPSPIKISGFLGMPEGARTSRNMSHFFINGRCVKTPLLLKAVTNAYGPVLPHRK